MATEDKQFVPRLVVVPQGSTVAFPNHDPFNHNVFSLSPEGPSILDSTVAAKRRSVRFDRAGVIRVYCNVHATMRALVAGAGDGAGALSRALTDPFRWTGCRRRLRASRLARAGTRGDQQLKVTDSGRRRLALTLDARGYRFVQHRDKNGRSYADRSRRY